MFLPTTKNELVELGWNELDIILISGDAYIDCPFDGCAIIGKVLLNAGYRVGIISQPTINSSNDIMRLGEPKLFWGVSAGAVDSMVANYTALKKPRRKDDLTPGGNNEHRPDRAVIAYSNLIKKYFKNTKPIVLGGVEASLRRIAHYDYWDNKIRRSILLDAKADILVYGMGEKAIIELADKLRINADYQDIRGICFIGEKSLKDYIELPSFSDVSSDKMKFLKMFNDFYQNNDPVNAHGLIQKYDNRYLIQNPPALHLTEHELDNIYEIDYEYDAHPYYKKIGKIKALETIRFSITSHRGCFGECNFCAIAIHQGRKIINRSRNSIVSEVKRLSERKEFNGYIYDVGGPTANMYQMNCKKQVKSGSCKDKRCLTPEICSAMNINHNEQIVLLKELRNLSRIKKIFIGSGLRYDLVVSDNKCGFEYLENIVENHISGQLKIAPEHTQDNVLKYMGKPSNKNLKKFITQFYTLNLKFGKKQFLTYYFIAAHPGCSLEDMKKLKKFIKEELKINPEQVQIFTPTPSTYSSLMYYLNIDPESGNEIYVEKEQTAKERQKKLITDY